jgi:hypothetical protein
MKKSYFSILFILMNSCGSIDCEPKFIDGKVFLRIVDGTNYCELVQRSLEGDSISFKELININYNNGLMISHSNTVMKIVENIDSNRMRNWIRLGIIENDRLMYLNEWSTTNK